MLKLVSPAGGRAGRRAAAESKSIFAAPPLAERAPAGRTRARVCRSLWTGGRAAARGRAGRGGPGRGRPTTTDRARADRATGGGNGGRGARRFFKDD